MNKIILFVLLIFFTLSANHLFSSGRVEIKFFSSETGYSILPDNLVLQDVNNIANSVRLSKSGNNYYAELPNSSYIITASKQGFISSTTYFKVNNGELNYRIFLDPVLSNEKLSQNRIKSLLLPDKALLLGFVVDDITGEPLSGVTMKNSTSVIGRTDGSGYFELSLPALCEDRTFADLSFEKTSYISSVYNDFEITSNTDFIFTVRMKKGVSPIQAQINTECQSCEPPSIISDLAVTGFVLPLNIRVGRNCTGTNCTTTEVYSLQTYCKYVLPAEIYSCWGNIANGMNSLQACATAVRTYGMYCVYNPINSNYDICDNTYCQFMGSTLSTNTSNAVDNTFGYILTNSSGVVRSEYSAENNNKGCGNGYSGTGSSWPCIYDPVCTNGTPNGHGRGLCQWGTVRWATGRLVSTSSPCSQGSAHSYGTKTWQQILEHYYKVSPNNWNVTSGTNAVINSSSSSPQSSNPCSQITINSNVTSNGNTSLMLGASIAPTGTTNWISDPANDVKRNFTTGTANYTRNFVIQCNTPSGSYDLYTALWYDKNNNNSIDGGDFVVNTKITTAAITISPIGINPVNSEIPSRFSLHPNYPNPFNPITKIRFDIPQRQQNVKIEIYDAKGTKVITLVNEQLKPGVYEIDWDASNYASGVYFYSLATDEFSETKRMVLIK